MPLIYITKKSSAYRTHKDCAHINNFVNGNRHEDRHFKKKNIWLRDAWKQLTVRKITLTLSEDGLIYLCWGNRLTDTASLTIGMCIVRDTWKHAGIVWSPWVLCTHRPATTPCLYTTSGETLAHVCQKYVQERFCSWTQKTANHSVIHQQNSQEQLLSSTLMQETNRPQEDEKSCTNNSQAWEKF